ncbi:MAG: ABC-2 family transporter protein [Bacillota bacterium]|nr:ABC-2 family transporter protein [Bacillota bacterium]
MLKTLRLYRIFVSQNMKKLMEYKIDFLTGAVGFFLNQIINIAFLWIIFSNIPNLKGWNFNEIIFIYGFSLIPKGLDHLMTDNLWKVGYFYVRKGEFDKYLIRPVNPLYHVIIEDFQVDAFGEIILGIILLASAIEKLHIPADPMRYVLIIIAVPFAMLIFTSLKIGTSAIAFWTKRSGDITHMLYMTNDFAKYPTTIYSSFVRNFITYILPFAFTAFYPADYFLTGNNPLFNIGGTVIAALVLFGISYFIWTKGIKAYESAGS